MNDKEDVAEQQDVIQLQIVLETDTIVILGNPYGRKILTKDIIHCLAGYQGVPKRFFYCDAANHFCQVLTKNGEFDGFRYCSDTQQAWLTSVISHG